ncbi:MAG: bifunctional [glutamate--ammonia ligase]-adenylyl-L-tyrosine phosphorylase/[glutamate--ammonia-ligase] adenylyltransferase [Alphaproteobacteria bacterium]|nr:MAG: bifunctional [glutamate--ammonia ligase]-adenylyl-L-tyrosine phosphorylase/[glutamate--ammonia-ligase] adenylyltransferase [Alphaproteobacteria bacterium]
MTFAARITRHPVPFDKERGQDVVAQYDGAPRSVLPLVEGTAGCSPYLAGLLERERDWLLPRFEAAPEEVATELIEGIGPEAVDASGRDGPGDLLRIAKGRIALLVALCDLAGVWPLARVTGVLTDFADAAVAAAIRAPLRREIGRGRLPGATEDDLSHGAGLVAIAMGKMGARELNYSSDIDLVMLFDETRFAPDDYHEVRAGFIRVVRQMTALLSETTATGYVFRTDLRLRPDAAVTPVCLAMETAERYYESLGRTWERAAYIKARAAAGDTVAGAAFLERLRPFVWRRYLDFAAIRDAQDMRLRIRAHKGLHGPILADGHDLKLGRGGIREIEFFVQTQQLIHGGRDPSLRVRGTLEGLDRLVAAGRVPADVAEELGAAYVAHRELEHRLQMVRDAQTHRLPRSAEEWQRLGDFMGGIAPDRLREEIVARLEAVDRAIAAFYPPEGGEAAAAARAEMALSEEERETVERWYTYPSVRSPRAAEIFTKIEPVILEKLRRAANPAEALRAFDGFLSGLPAGVQVFSLFEANPHLIDLVVDVVATAPALAGYLSRNAGVFEAVIVGDFFAAWPGVDALRDGLADAIAREDDYEGKLDAARRWAREWRFRIGVHSLRGLIDAAEAGRQYAELAEAVLSALLPTVMDEFRRRHGDFPDGRVAVVGMGSLGAARLHAQSDLDLIVVYDAPMDAMSDGARALPARTYYARLTQAFVTAISAPTAAGRLYEVDMRLRPSGRQGPVATAFRSFGSYQREEAWTWEHMALTRARAIAGDARLSDAFEAERRSIIRDVGAPRRVLEGLSDMRRRLAEAMPAPTGPLDVKNGAGGLKDIELLAEAGALLAASPERAVARQLKAAADAGWLSGDEAAALTDAQALFWTVRQATRLLGGSEAGPDALGEGARDYLLRETDAGDMETLAATLAEKRAQARAIIDAAAARLPAETEQG